MSLLAAGAERTDVTLYTALVGLFAGLLVIANVIAVKPVTIGPFVVPAAVVVYAMTFLVTDTVAEVWGKERAQAVVWTGFGVSIFVALWVQVAIRLPGAAFWQEQAAFATILGANLRVVAASMLAYLVSQLHDVWAFHFWKAKTGGRHLWWRNTASTAVSQLLDTTIFITVAFYGLWPNLGAAILGQYVVKVAVAVLDTPLVYAAVAAARRLTAGAAPAGVPRAG